MARCLLYRIVLLTLISQPVTLLAQTAEKPAMLIFYRAEADDIANPNASLFAGEQRLGTVNWGHFIITRATPGLYRFALSPPMPGVEYFSIIVRSGDELYLRINRDSITVGSSADAYATVPTLTPTSTTPISRALPPAPPPAVISIPVPARTTLAPSIIAPSAPTPTRNDNVTQPPAPVAGQTAPAVRQLPPESFPKVTLNVQVGDKKKEIDAIIKYEASAFVVADKKTGAALKTIQYAAVKSAEYSYAKSPRWKTAILVNPLFLFTSGKKHWFMVQGDGDYALMQLDKSNYKLILAAFETRTGQKVETVEDSK